MSVLLYLTDKQQQVMQSITTSDDVTVEWQKTGIEITKENYIPIMDAVQKTILNEVMFSSDTDDRDTLAIIATRLITLGQHFPNTELENTEENNDEQI